MPAQVNYAAVLHGAKDLRLVSTFNTSLPAAALLTAVFRSQEKRSIEAPGPGEAQVAVKATGLCGSDLHYYVRALRSGVDGS